MKIDIDEVIALINKECDKFLKIDFEDHAYDAKFFYSGCITALVDMASIFNDMKTKTELLNQKTV